MLPKTIDSALQNLRRDLIRNGGDGLEHVEALMRIRGITPDRERRWRKPDHSPRWSMSRMVLEALRDGPQRHRDIAAKVHAQRPDLAYVEARVRSGQALARLKRRGLVEREGRVWSANAP